MTTITCTVIKFEYLGDDKGNCRVYYVSSNGYLYCFQQGLRRDTVELYTCTNDGEPNHQVKAFKEHVTCLFEPCPETSYNHEVVNAAIPEFQSEAH